MSSSLPNPPRGDPHDPPHPSEQARNTHSSAAAEEIRGMTDDPARSGSTLVLVMSGATPFPAPKLLQHLSGFLNATHGDVQLKVLIDRTQTATWSYRLDGLWLHPTQVHHTLATAFSYLPAHDRSD